jgi:hypothetical protein
MRCINPLHIASPSRVVFQLLRSSGNSVAVSHFSGANTMAQRYRVTLFNDGIRQPGAAHVVKAATPEQAAEVGAGEVLKVAGLPSKLRAQVQPVTKPQQRRMFYR